MCSSSDRRPVNVKVALMPTAPLRALRPRKKQTEIVARCGQRTPVEADKWEVWVQEVGVVRGGRKRAVAVLYGSSSSAKMGVGHDGGLWLCRAAFSMPLSLPTVMLSSGALSLTAPTESAVGRRHYWRQASYTSS
jgi:hypothetical protein